MWVGPEVQNEPVKGDTGREQVVHSPPFSRDRGDPRSLSHHAQNREDALLARHARKHGAHQAVPAAHCARPGPTARSWRRSSGGTDRLPAPVPTSRPLHDWDEVSRRRAAAAHHHPRVMVRGRPRACNTTRESVSFREYHLGSRIWIKSCQQDSKRRELLPLHNIGIFTG